MKEVTRIQHYKAEQFRHSEAQEIKDFLIGTDYYIEPSNYGTRGTLYFVDQNGDSLIRGLVFKGDWLLLRQGDAEIEIVRRDEFVKEFPDVEQA